MVVSAIAGIGVACGDLRRGPPVRRRLEPTRRGRHTARGQQATYAVAADAQAAASDEDDATAAARLNAASAPPAVLVMRVLPAGIGADGTRYTVVRVDLAKRSPLRAAANARTGGRGRPRRTQGQRRR